MKTLFNTIIMLLLLSNCTNTNTEKTANTVTNEADENLITVTHKQLQSLAIKTGIMEDKIISTTIKVTGKIEVPPQNLVSVSVPIGGYIKHTGLLPGMHLNKGDVIAVIEDQQYIQLQQDYLTTKAKLEMAESEYLRQKDLNESKASSDKVFQMAKTEYKMLQITLNALSEKLKLININASQLNEQNISKSIKLYSPFNGFVSSVKVNVGQYVTPTDVLFELVNPNDIHLNLKVFEKDLIQLAAGQKLIAYNNSQPQKKYDCEIILISKDIAKDGSAEVHCHFDKYDKILVPGMYMNAEIELKNNKVASVPENAVVNYNGSNYLFVAVNDSTFKMQTVQVGEQENGWIEIQNHNEFKNKNIVFAGSYSLLMGLKNKQEE